LAVRQPNRRRAEDLYRIKYRQADPDTLDEEVTAA